MTTRSPDSTLDPLDLQAARVRLLFGDVTGLRPGTSLTWTEQFGRERFSSTLSSNWPGSFLTKRDGKMPLPLLPEEQVVTTVLAQHEYDPQDVAGRLVIHLFNADHRSTSLTLEQDDVLNALCSVLRTVPKETEDATSLHASLSIMWSRGANHPNEKHRLSLRISQVAQDPLELTKEAMHATAKAFGNPQRFFLPRNLIQDILDAALQTCPPPTNAQKTLHDDLYALFQDIKTRGTDRLLAISAAYEQGSSLSLDGQGLLTHLTVTDKEKEEARKERAEWSAGLYLQPIGASLHVSPDGRAELRGASQTMPLNAEVCLVLQRTLQAWQTGSLVCLHAFDTVHVTRFTSLGDGTFIAHRKDISGVLQLMLARVTQALPVLNETTRTYLQHVLPARNNR